MCTCAHACKCPVLTVLCSIPRPYSLETGSLTASGAGPAANLPCSLSDLTTRIIGVCNHAQPFMLVLAFKLRPSNVHSKCSSHPRSRLPARPLLRLSVPLPAGIISVNHHTQFMWCWGVKLRISYALRFLCFTLYCHAKCWPLRFEVCT